MNTGLQVLYGRDLQLSGFTMPLLWKHFLKTLQLIYNKLYELTNHCVDTLACLSQVSKAIASAWNIESSCIFRRLTLLSFTIRNILYTFMYHTLGFHVCNFEFINRMVTFQNVSFRGRFL